MTTYLSKILFRKATVKDAISLAKHRVQFLNELDNSKHASKAVTLEKELFYYFEQAIKNQSVIAWVAESDNQIIATSSIVFWHAPPSYSGLGRQGKRAYILNMFTVKSFRKKGIAKMLLDKLIEEAKQLDVEFIHLNATNDGMNIYRKAGFETSYYPELTLKLH